jgi:hypothetical protein
MIPKVIHYCWFGKTPLPEKVLKYMESWRKNFPDCQIKEWNESNFDVNRFEYTREAYFAKKFAFVSDVARLYALVNEGGLYLDTDVLVLKPLDSYFWEKKAFLGFEHDSFVGTGVIASEAHHPFFEEFLSLYLTRTFFKGLKYDEETNVSKITCFFEEKGLVRNNTEQQIEDVIVCCQDCFCNKDWYSGTYYNNEKSFMIHDFQSSWCDGSKNFLLRVKRKLKKISTIVLYKFVRHVSAF